MPMSPASKPKHQPSIDALDDLLLGLYGALVPESRRLDHAVRYFSTWSGSDKLMMVTQYGVKLLAPLLQRRAELQFAAGLRPKPVSPSTEGLYAFARTLSAARRVSGFWGILSILKGLSALERSRPPSRVTLNLQRLQGVSMLIFYPLEYISFFSTPSLAPILPVTPAQSLRASLWSVRAWGVYVLLQIALLVRELMDIVNGLKVAKVDGKVDGNGKEGEKEGESEHARTAALKRRRAIMYQLVANVSRLPVILHWSLVKGFYKNELWTNGLSFISAVASIRGGWEANRLPSPKR